jgi:hypothetical protein
MNGTPFKTKTDFFLIHLVYLMLRDEKVAVIKNCSQLIHTSLSMAGLLK